MAGRDIPPPPNVISEFSVEWRNWLYLLFRKVKQRTFTISIPGIAGLDDPLAAITTRMTDGMIGIAPVALAEAGQSQNRRFSFTLPDDWVQGSPLTMGIVFANVEAPQTGVVNVVSEILLKAIPVGDFLGDQTGAVATINTALPSNVDLGILHYDEISIAPGPLYTPGMSMHFKLTRESDSCVGDVGYKDILIKYTGLINHE